MQTTQTTLQAVSSNAITATRNRILARVVLQAWGGRKGDDAIFVGEKNIDVTDAILLLDHELLIELMDGTEQTDEIGLAHLNHSGPLEVYVTDSICEFFDVDSIKDITLAALEEARRVVNPKRATDPALPSFMQLLARANAVSLDDGALLTDWTTDEWAGRPENEVVRFAWTDGDHDYSEILTEQGIVDARFDDSGRVFFVTNREGYQTIVKFFMLEQIGVNNLRN